MSTPQRNPNSLSNLRRGGYTKDNQPTLEQKQAGWKRKKAGRALAQAVLALAFKGQTDSELRKQAAEYFNIPEDRITVEAMMLFRQAEKAIQKGDTAAFRAIMERAHGLPKQELDLTSLGQSLAPKSTIIVQDEETRQALLNLKQKPTA